jgi:hypothetical protein
VAQERSGDLRALVAEKGRGHQARRLGAVADVVLLERRAGRHEGVTEDYLTVYLPADVPSPARFAGRLARRDDVLTAEPCAA